MIICLIEGYRTDLSVVINTAGRWFERYGPLDVEIVLLLSGFTIAGLLLRRHSEVDIKVYFLHRVSRILVFYFVAVAAFAVASVLTDIEADLIAWV